MLYNQRERTDIWDRYASYMSAFKFPIKLTFYETFS
jgi:hypothetical protein